MTDLESVLLADVSVPLQDLEILEDLPFAVLEGEGDGVVAEQIRVVLRNNFLVPVSFTFHMT